MVVVYQRKGYDVLGNREVLSGWKNKSIRFIIGKMEVEFYEKHKSIRND